MTGREATDSNGRGVSILASMTGGPFGGENGCS